MTLDVPCINGQELNDRQISIGIFGEGHLHAACTQAGHDTWVVILASGYTHNSVIMAMVD